MKILIIKLKISAAALIILLDNVGLFATASAATLPRVNISTDEQLSSVIICGVAVAMFWVLLALTTVLVIIAAYRYLTSAGDPEKVRNATRTLTYAAVAVIVALLAKSFAPIVSSFVGGITAGTATGAVPNQCQ